MSHAAATAPEPAAPPESSARERMGVLRRMSEIGLRMAERLDRQSEIAALRAEGAILPDDAREDCARKLDDMARSFAQVSRAVSVCIALEDRIERGPPIPEPQANRPFGPELVCAVPRESRLRTRRDEVEAGVRGAIDLYAEVSPGRVNGLLRRLDDLLDREVAAVDAFLTRPVDEIIARLCDRLGLDFDLAGLQRAGARFRPRMTDLLETGEAVPTASQDAADPSIPCRERSLPVRAAQGAALRAARGAAGLRPGLEQPEPASKIACMGSRTVGAPGP
jgi:hypothetical protein